MFDESFDLKDLERLVAVCRDQQDSKTEPRTPYMLKIQDSSHTGEVSLSDSEDLHDCPSYSSSRKKRLFRFTKSSVGGKLAPHIPIRRSANADA